MKLWQKNITANELIEKFTVGNDREFDLLLAPFDVKGSSAHAEMLRQCGLLSAEENKKTQDALREIGELVSKPGFQIDPAMEDIHSQIEFLLVEKAGDAGKKIHSGRSRNDQVLLCIKLFLRNELKKIAEDVAELFDLLLELSQEHKDVLLPGYTHLQVAMPSSFGLWFAAWAESFSDDMEFLIAAERICNKNPLGSAAGYGSSFPISRETTTEILGFSGMNVNSVYAQMTRGKTEKACATALSAFAATLGKMAMDITLYCGSNYNFFSFPAELTTGSSIMPHKKNPDAWELIRAKCNRIIAVPNEFSLLLGNLPSGYHRDLQLTKEILFPAIISLRDCIQIAVFQLRQIIVNKNILSDPKYDYLFTVDAVNELVMQGVSFREAYRQIGFAVENGIFEKPQASQHTHTGSIGNLGNNLIREKFDLQMKQLV